MTRKRENAHVYAHKPSMHTNKWIQDANDKLKHGSSVQTHVALPEKSKGIYIQRGRTNSRR
jgi:hypothetical protein